MGRRKNQDYWNQVTKVTVEENGKVKEKVKCKRCGDVFAGGVSRIRPHVDQIPGKGISVCTVDPVDEGVHNNVASGSSIPQEAMNVANSLQVEDAYQPIDSSIGGSINHQDNVESNYLVEVAPELIGTNIGGSINHQSNVEFNYFVKGAPGMISTNIGGPVNHQDTVEYGDAHGMISDDIGGPVDHQDNVEYGGLRHNVNENNNVTGAFEEEINQLSQIISDLQRDEDDIKGQLQWLESRGKKRKREDDNWLHELEGFKRRAGHMIQSRSLSGIEKFTQEVEKHNQSKPLVLSNEIVGYRFVKKFKKVWKLLEDDQVLIIGIYGMGGVGKTFLAKYVKDEIKRKGTWDVFE